jgi:hypothetical protein
MWHFSGDDIGTSLMPIMIFSVPIVAIVGGITMGIVRTITQSRVIENAQRERIAAIQAGIDPSKLPPIPHMDLDDSHEAAMNPEAAMRRRTNGLLVGGVVTLFVGIGLGLFLWIVDSGGASWSVGLIPGFVGLGLLLSSFLVRPRGGI